MTINGPAAAMTAFFLNAAIDQQCELFIQQNGMEDEVRAKIAQMYAAKGQTQPRYNSAPELFHQKETSKRKMPPCPKAITGLDYCYWVLRATKYCPPKATKK